MPASHSLLHKQTRKPHMPLRACGAFWFTEIHILSLTANLHKGSH